MCVGREIDGSLTVSVFQIQCGKMDSPRQLIQIKQQEKPHWKQYLELRKKFGLTKEERVYLKRIPLRSSCEELEERVCSSNSLKRKSDSLDSSSLDVETTNQHQECVTEEKVSQTLTVLKCVQQHLQRAPCVYSVPSCALIWTLPLLDSSGQVSNYGRCQNRSYILFVCHKGVGGLESDLSNLRILLLFWVSWEEI